MNRYTENAKADFECLRDSYKMEVVLDQDLHRHLQFRAESFAGWFDVITWPGHLCIRGDYGTFVFSRTPDMFEFFGEGRINPSYWAEKVEAESVFGDGCTTYSKERLWDGIRDYVEDRDDAEELLTALRDELSPIDQDDEWDLPGLIARITSFEWHGDLPFECAWEINPNVYTFHYLWCCYATTWAIGQYNRWKSNHTDGRDL